MDDRLVGLGTGDGTEATALGTLNVIGPADCHHSSA